MEKNEGRHDHRDDREQWVESGDKEPLNLIYRSSANHTEIDRSGSFRMKSAYAISKLRKFGYSKQGFYKEAFELYKEINAYLAHGDKTSLRKLVTENMFSIGVDRNDLKKVFIQLTLEFLTNQKFEAYNSEGTAVAGDKNKEVLVRDIWVFEKSLFHPGAYWRLCGRIPPPK
uniref:Large ribosomal subunit protein mL45 n=1 Tax=Chenopodium quinoa TaxID=63459 RepID=A0A803KPA5_CHEQI